MEKKCFNNIILIFSIIGLLFSGTLSYFSMILGKCLLKDPCPVFFKLPSCFYGFILFLTLIILSVLALIKEKKRDNLMKWIFYISIIAVLYAIFSAGYEIFYLCADGSCRYSLGLPTCVYGLIMYLVIFFSAFMYRRNK
jgi:hypothetical protein